MASTADSGERWTALRRLLVLHGSENLTQEQSTRLEQTLWSGRELSVLVEDIERASFYPTVLLSLPGAAEREVGLGLRGQFLAYPFPSTDGQLGSDRNLAERRARYHLDSIARILEEHGPPLTAGEASELLVLTLAWLRGHQSRQGHGVAPRSAGLRGDPLLSTLIDLLVQHVLPAIGSAESADAETLTAIRAGLGKEPVSSLPLEYDIQRLGLSEPMQSVSRLIDGLRSGNDMDVIAAASGILVWLEKETNPPRELFDELLAVVQRPGSRWFSIVLGKAADFVDAHHQRVGPREVDRIVSILDRLVGETDVTNVQNDRLYVDPAWMPDARAASATLAAVMWKHFPALRGGLEHWHTVGSTDPVPAVREAWREVTERSE